MSDCTRTNTGMWRVFWWHFPEQKQRKLTKQSLRALSSVGSEHLSYKQGVIGSNPIVPTKRYWKVRPPFQKIPVKCLGKVSYENGVKD